MDTSFYVCDKKKGEAVFDTSAGDSIVFSRRVKECSHLEFSCIVSNLRESISKMLPAIPDGLIWRIRYEEKHEPDGSPSSFWYVTLTASACVVGGKKGD